MTAHEIDRMVKDNVDVFANLWYADATCEEWHRAFIKPVFGNTKYQMTSEQWDNGWQWRVVNHEDMERGMEELIDIVAGCY